MSVKRIPKTVKSKFQSVIGELIKDKFSSVASIEANLLIVTVITHSAIGCSVQRSLNDSIAVS